VPRRARIRRLLGGWPVKAIRYLPLLASLTGAACASSRPPPAVAPSVGSPAVVAPPPQVPAAPPAGSAAVVAQPWQIPVEARGKRLLLTLPEGFAREPAEASKLGDVLVASATRPGKYRIQIFYDPDVPVTNAQIPEFGRYLVATAGQNLPNFQLGSHGVVSDKPAKVFFVPFVDAKDDTMGAILIRSLAGSPLRVMIMGPRTIDGVRDLPAFMKQMMDTLGDGAP